jgi:hypothetical protein
VTITYEGRHLSQFLVDYVEHDACIRRIYGLFSTCATMGGHLFWLGHLLVKLQYINFHLPIFKVAPALNTHYLPPAHPRASSNQERSLLPVILEGLGILFRERDYIKVV